MLLATENNGTRCTVFRPMEKSIRSRDWLTGVSAGHLLAGHCRRSVFATAYGKCTASIERRMKTFGWGERMFYDHTNVIGGNGRVLVWTNSGDLCA
ncbi:MAG: hypothetical protein CM1200mP29_03970 [Verrucomicrobiota bacterium]|nr:MAG: hypothetical protein CM1200mP29_03970 [Verrucomicrobiota bacterium]